MARKIKFRAWVNNHNAMHFSTDAGIDQLIEWANRYGGQVMQYTGLNDRNGSEIYEGDILVSKSYPFYGDDACTELNYVGEVFWSEDDLSWGYDIHRVSDRVAGRACGGGLVERDNWEVIGNLHDNPELIR